MHVIPPLLLQPVLGSVQVEPLIFQHLAKSFKLLYEVQLKISQYHLPLPHYVFHLTIQKTISIHIKKQQSFFLQVFYSGVEPNKEIWDETRNVGLFFGNVPNCQAQLQQASLVELS